MAENYTDDEQVEALKRWWNENGKSTLLSIALAVAAVFGWQGWQEKQETDMHGASAVYQNLLAAAAGNNGGASEQQVATANHLAETLKKDYPSSTYADFAALYKARFAVEADDLVTAEQELRWVIDGGTTDELMIQTRLRLARVLHAQGEHDQALQVLTGDTLAYASAYEELRGDIYLAQGDKAAAELAYQKATDLNQQGVAPLTNPILEIKRQQLKSELLVATPVPLTTAPTSTPTSTPAVGTEKEQAETEQPSSEEES
ncbi:MAG: putative negative regulator of RcsB-dependent stress response [Oceanicoccus sp.]|jgi:predicted negative regulator of RcsB-dependent stress response